VNRFRTVAVERAAPVAANPLSIENLNQRDLFADEVHPTAVGYARTAAALLETLESEGLLPTVPP
jgi:lysophospholipase L1-like esterase